MSNAVLVIKLGALGDMIQALGPLAAIRAQHPDARITLLTTKPFAGLMEACPWVDDVVVDTRPKLWDVSGVARLLRVLRQGWTMVYDLQTSSRSSRYLRLLRRGVPASGIGRGASYPHTNPQRDCMHTIDRQAEQLAMAGIKNTPLPSLDWVPAQETLLPLPAHAVALLPGGAPTRPEKLWPAAYYATLAEALRDQGLAPVVLGTAHEAPLAQAIPAALDLTGKTDLRGLVDVLRRCAGAVGNDTGPMHVAAVLGKPALVLFGPASDPALCAPRGDRVTVMRADALDSLAPEDVGHKFAEMLRGHV